MGEGKGARAWAESREKREEGKLHFGCIVCENNKQKGKLKTKGFNEYFVQCSKDYHSRCVVH